MTTENEEMSYLLSSAELHVRNARTELNEVGRVLDAIRRSKEK